MAIPKFFDPAARDRAQAEEMRAVIRRFLETQRRQTSDRRIFRLNYVHNGELRVAQVGELFGPELPETVIAIFEGEGIFYVCTPNRGVRRDEPVLVGASGTRVTDFDPD